MKIAFISFGHVDVAITLLKYIAQSTKIDLYLVFSKKNRRESIINFDHLEAPARILSHEMTLNIIPSEIRNYINNRFNYSIFIYDNFKIINIKNIAMSYRFSKILREQQYNCIHFNGNNFQQLPISLFTPNIAKVHTIHDYEAHSGEKNKWAQRINKMLMFSKNQKIMHSRNIASYAHPRIKSSLNIIYYGPLEIYKKWEKSDVIEEHNTLLFFGRISPYKGIEYLIESISIVRNIIPEIKLIIAGAGKYYFNIDNLLNDPAYEIINRYLSNEELVKLIQRSSTIICPYTDATQSGVIMTAFAFNKPVIASAVGGISELILHDETGILVPPRNPEALANAIIKLLLNSHKLNELKKNIEMKCEKSSLSWDSIAEQTINVYRKAVEQKH